MGDIIRLIAIQGRVSQLPSLANSANMCDYRILIRDYRRKILCVRLLEMEQRWRPMERKIPHSISFSPSRHWHTISRHFKIAARLLLRSFVFRENPLSSLISLWATSRIKFLYIYNDPWEQMTMTFVQWLFYF